MLIKYLLVAGVSGLAGYYVCELKYSKKFQESVDRETADIREHYERKYKKKLVEDATSADPEFVEAAINAAEALGNYTAVDVRPEVLATEMITVTKEFDEEEFKNNLEKEAKPDTVVPVTLVPEGPNPPRINYNAISTPPKPVKVEEAPAEGASSDEEIEIIDEDAFRQNQFGYVQTSLTYYSVDDVISTPSDKTFSRLARQNFIGQENMRLIKNLRSQQVFYIRNRKQHVELEIEFDHRSYAEITGIPVVDSDIVDTVEELD